MPRFKKIAVGERESEGNIKHDISKYRSWRVFISGSSLIRQRDKTDPIDDLNHDATPRPLLGLGQYVS